MLGGHVLSYIVVNVLAEGRLCVGQRNSVLRTLRPGDRRHDIAQVQLDVLGVLRLPFRVVPHALFLGVCLDKRQLFFAAAGHLQIVDRDLVDRENRCGGAELGTHVAQCRAVRQRHLGDAFAVELDELAHHAVLAQHLGDGEDDVGGRDAGRTLAGQLEPDNAGNQHRHRLAQHGRLGLDAADAPTQDAEAVLHRGVRVGADARVRVRDADFFALPGFARPSALPHHLGQVFDVDLVHDSGAGRHHLEVVERALAPAQELIALAVALVLDLDVALECVFAAEEIGYHGVVDHQIGGCQRIDLVGFTAEVGDGLPHGGQVDDAGHPGEVLHDHAGGGELDLHARVGIRVPVRDRLDMLLGHVRAVLGAQQVLGEHLEAVGEFLGALHRVQAVDLIALVPDLEGGAGIKRVWRRILAAHINSRLCDCRPSRRFGFRRNGLCRRLFQSNSTLVL